MSVSRRKWRSNSIEMPSSVNNLITYGVISIGKPWKTHAGVKDLVLVCGLLSVVVYFWNYKQHFLLLFPSSIPSIYSSPLSFKLMASFFIVYYIHICIFIYLSTPSYNLLHSCTVTICMFWGLTKWCALLQGRSPFLLPAFLSCLEFFV